MNRLALTHDEFAVLEQVYNSLTDLHPAHRTTILDGLRELLLGESTSDPRRAAATIAASVKSCRQCGDDVYNDPVPSRYNTVEPDICIVLDQDLERTANFEALIAACQEHDIPSRRVMFTAVAKCPMKEGNNDEVRNRCAERYLWTELRIARPRLIVTVGSEATNLVFGSDVRITEIAGSITWIGIWPVLPVLSPGTIHHRASAADDITQQFAIARNFLYGSSKPERAETHEDHVT